MEHREEDLVGLRQMMKAREDAPRDFRPGGKKYFGHNLIENILRPTSKMPSANMRTDLIIVSFEVERVTST